MNRRSFVWTAGVAGARLLAADRIRTGVIGSGGRGRLLAGEFKEVGADVAAVCDVYEPNLEAGLKVASTGAVPYTDYRRLLENKSLEAVIIATPDHWHTRMLIDAVEAGKDVYLEKPIAHNIADGFRIVEATRRTRRIVQVGTQRRSSELFRSAKGVVDSGAVGDVRLITAQWMNSQPTLAQTQFTGKIDWKAWLGPAAEREPSALRFFNWYYFYDYAVGMIGSQAAHIVDCVQWFMGSREPVAVSMTGLRSNIEGAEIPETASMTVEFPQNYMLVFSLSYQAMHYAFYGDQLKQFHGTKARFDVGREWYALYPQTNERELKASTNVSRPGSFLPATRAHVRNFLDCVHSRNEPNAPVESGNAANVVIGMAMESLRTGRRLRWDAVAHRVV